MKSRHPEEEIRSRLRELTEETRRVREELRQMIRRDPAGKDRPDFERMMRLRRGKKNR